ncbi:hypothetical protein ACFLWI_00705 [Chloroflexota bacterium]
MDNTVIASIISAIGGIIIAVITYIVAPKITSTIYRSRNKVPPNIIGSWNVEWMIGDEVYSRDRIEIMNWEKNNVFKGMGDNEKGNYIISGEVFSSNLLIGHYKNESYPTKGYLGSFTMRLSIDGKRMSGMWEGVTINEKIEGGAINCSR